MSEDISEEELKEYLTALAFNVKFPSRSGFKHNVYGLRYYYRHVGLAKCADDLFFLKKDFKLPVILNRSELKTSIQKEVSLHSMRLSYATHLLEDGLNIVTIKELPGHAKIATTMI